MSTDGGESVPAPVSTATASTSVPAAVPASAAPQPYLMLVFPFVVFALVVLVRALPWSERASNAKPLSCDVCMTFWCSVAFGIFLTWFAAAHWSWTLLHMFPVPGITLFLLALYKWLIAPRELPLPPSG